MLTDFNTNLSYSIELGLKNRRNEANAPLIALAKKYLNLDIEEIASPALTEHIVYHCKELSGQHNRLNNIFKKCFGDDITVDVFLRETAGQQTFTPQLEEKLKEHKNREILFKELVKDRYNRKTNKYFNYLEDVYSKVLVDDFLKYQNNQLLLITRLERFSKDHLVKNLKRKFLQEIAGQKASSEFLDAIENIIVNIEDRNNCIGYFKKLKINPLLENQRVQKTIEKHLLFEEVYNHDEISLNELSIEDLYDLVKERVNFELLRIIKKKQTKEIYDYDGIEKQYLPMTLRGMYDVNKETVKKIGFQGDLSDLKHLFNGEISTGARKSNQSFGHTGSSNRSSTPVGHIATYFATRHAAYSGEPNSSWVFIYEAMNGANMTKYIKKGSWSELEVVTPTLKPKHFLGAVKLKITENSHDQIRLIAEDGFVSRKVLEDDFEKFGLMDEALHYLNIAKKFTEAQKNNIFEDQMKVIAEKNTAFEYILPKHNIDKYRTSFQKKFDLGGIDPRNFQQQRLAQKSHLKTQNTLI